MAEKIVFVNLDKERKANDPVTMECVEHGWNAGGEPVLVLEDGMERPLPAWWVPLDEAVEVYWRAISNAT